MGTYPVTFADQRFTSASFAKRNYVHGFPSLMQAFVRAMTRRTTLTFQAVGYFLPVLGPTRLMLPPGLPIIPWGALSFSAVTTDGHFVFRVYSYDSLTGDTSGSIVDVVNPESDIQWNVGLKPNTAVNSVTHGATSTGLWLPEHYDLARRILDLPSSRTSELIEEFHTGHFPDGWLGLDAFTGNTLSFGPSQQWNGAGTYSSRSYMHLEPRVTATDPFLVEVSTPGVYGPPDGALQNHTDFTLYLRFRADHFNSGFKILKMELSNYEPASPYLGDQISIGARDDENSGNYVLTVNTTSLDTFNTSIAPGGVAGGWENWVIRSRNGNTVFQRNGVTVRTSPVSLRTGLYAFRMHVSNMTDDPVNPFLDIDTLWMRGQ